MNIINMIEDKDLKQKVLDIINDLTVEIGGSTYKGLRLEESPASLSRHHSYTGGLLEHILSTIRIALILCDCVEDIYHGKVNRDNVISGVILHDIFKPLMYVQKKEGGYAPSPLAEKVDHLTLITTELSKRGFPLDVIHIVCAHHGDAGPLSPKTIEALICHAADVADSTLNGKVLRAAKYLIREVTGRDIDVLNSEMAFEVIRRKSLKGWEGVRKFIENFSLKTDS